MQEKHNFNHMHHSHYKLFYIFPKNHITCNCWLYWKIYCIM